MTVATLRTSTVYRDGPLTVLAVASAESSARRGYSHWYVSGVMNPVAIVVCGPGEPYAVDTAGNPLDIDQLRRDVADLDALLVSSVRVDITAQQGGNPQIPKTNEIRTLTY
jgi:hypothetical protein